MLTLESLLSPFGFDPRRKVRLVRHQDDRYDVMRLYRSGQLDIYQAIQARPIFGDAQTLVTFVGQPGTHALFVGVYEVKAVEGPATYDLPEDFLYPDMLTAGCYRYKLTHDSRFSDLEGRLVIDWGLGTRSWVQHFKSRSVVEVLPAGYVRAFPGFLDVVLTYDELVKVIKNPTSHRDWHRMLKSVAGVYLILDLRTGLQYVGSAYGTGGILGRWESYANSGHGGNLQLRELLKVRPEAQRDFQFAVLQTLPTSLTAREVISYEVLHKQKLGTRAHGLNSN
jgi:hypothetical protein